MPKEDFCFDSKTDFALGTGKEDGGKTSGLAAANIILSFKKLFSVILATWAHYDLMSVSEYIIIFIFSGLQIFSAGLTVSAVCLCLCVCVSTLRSISLSLVLSVSI